MWTTRLELEHQVVALYQQRLTRRAIARALGISRNTVRKILTAHGQARRAAHTQLSLPPDRPPRPQRIDAFRERVRELLARYPEITAQRVFEELKGAGYQGGYTQVKAHVRKVRPPKPPRPSLPTPSYGPGKMAESDWSTYTIDFLDGVRRTLQVFSYVLVWSHRKDFGLFERNDLHALMDGHVATFERFHGVAQECKYDGQKTVVLGWEGAQPIYNPRFLAFATYYEFRPRAVRPYHPNDKPRTERSFWEFEQSFLNGRRFRDPDDMRRQLGAWLDGTCDLRRRKQGDPTPLERFAKEQPHLGPLPTHPYDTARVLYRLCSIDGFVAIDGNRYAVPYDHVTDILPVRVTRNEVFVYAADLQLVARHERAPRGAGRTVAPPGSHPPWKRCAADVDQLRSAFDDLGDQAALFFTGLCTAQPRGAGHHARQILLLRERYATSDLVAALARAHAFGAFEYHAVERIVAARAAPRRLAEYVAAEAARKLGDHPGADDAFLHDLDDYDRLPITTGTQEPTCPPPESPPTPTTSSPVCDDTSKSSG